MKILRWPHRKLSTKTKKVTNIQEQVEPYLDGMVSLMRDCSGAGLAANQVGIDRSFFILEQSEIYEKNPPLVMINPVIIDGFGETVSQEGCLSVPGERFSCLRSIWIKVKFENLEGEQKEEAFSGFVSIAIQHEIDHLNGITLADSAPAEKIRDIISSSEY